MVISVAMYKRLGLSNTDIALYTSWLYLPWVIKPLWCPFVDIIKTRRWWILSMEILIGAGLAGVAFTLPGPHFFRASLAFFWLMAFSSATHDIAADGYYMLELSPHEQTLFVGIRSTFYRIATILGQGALVMFAGILEMYTRRTVFAWALTFYVMASFFLLIALYHFFYLPKAVNDKPGTLSGIGEIVREFLRTFLLFLRKPQIATALAFMLLYRLPEALLLKVNYMFLFDPVSEGGLGLSTQEIGMAQGTVGVIGMVLGGILGGIAASRHGLKRWLWPMVASLTLPDAVYVILSLWQIQNLTIISACFFVEQFGYGFGFTAYMLYLLYFSRGKHQTAHYAICTGFMAMSLMLPGMAAGWLQKILGYPGFFLLVMACCLVTVTVTLMLRIDPEFGKKKR